jgi:hypothetical protein
MVKTRCDELDENIAPGSVEEQKRLLPDKRPLMHGDKSLASRARSQIRQMCRNWNDITTWSNTSVELSKTRPRRKEKSKFPHEIAVSFQRFGIMLRRHDDMLHIFWPREKSYRIFIMAISMREVNNRLI